MRTALRFVDLAVGECVLIHDHIDDDWVMVERIGMGMASPNYRVRVTWTGFVPDGSPTAYWEEDGAIYDYYRVAPANVEAIIMAARHMSKEQWFRFARRQSERQKS